MTILSDILDTRLLTRHIENGLVGAQTHPTLPLTIFNYTPKAQFEPCWGDGTIDYCRGLIVGPHQEVIARPFKKFHNINTPGIPETEESYLKTLVSPWEITEKLDGSLGILWEYEGECGIATRGSFTSPQAQWATHWYLSKFPQLSSLRKLWQWPTNYTPLFEIIYKQNQIVVEYPFEGLILIGLINKKTGQELPHQQLREWSAWNGIECAKRYHFSLEELLKINRPNEEGFVVTYPITGRPPVKVKVKMEDYVRLHRIVTGLNPRSIWEMLSKTGLDERFIDIGKNKAFSESFTKWLLNWEKKLRDEFNRIKTATKDYFEKRPYHWADVSDREYRKKFSDYVFTIGPREWHGILFGMLNVHYGKRPAEDIDLMIWRLVKPRGDDKTFRVDGE